MLIDLDWGDAAMFFFGWIVGIGWAYYVFPKWRKR
jgi:uncharacterized membrane protein YccC